MPFKKKSRKGKENVAAVQLAANKAKDPPAPPLTVEVPRIPVVDAFNMISAAVAKIDCDQATTLAHIGCLQAIAIAIKKRVGEPK